MSQIRVMMRGGTIRDFYLDLHVASVQYTRVPGW